jgi:hypothetical protein
MFGVMPNPLLQAIFAIITRWTAIFLGYRRDVSGNSDEFYIKL